MVDFFDFHIWKSIYHASAGEAAGSISNVPEPAGLTLWLLVISLPIQSFYRRQLRSKSPVAAFLLN